jgi:F0F1-type ATP synthase assembly protein I
MASSFLCGAGVSYFSNAYSAYILLIYKAKSLKEEARRFYIAEFGKWSIAVTLFALIFLYVNVTEPLIFFGAFIFSNFITIFLQNYKVVNNYGGWGTNWFRIYKTPFDKSNIWQGSN